MNIIIKWKCFIALSYTFVHSPGLKTRIFGGESFGFHVQILKVYQKIIIRLKPSTPFDPYTWIY